MISSVVPVKLPVTRLLIEFHADPKSELGPNANGCGGVVKLYDVEIVSPEKPWVWFSMRGSQEERCTSAAH
jgi:hypothetical protein